MRYIFSAIVMLLLTSCAHVISRENVQSALTETGFEQITKNPDAFVGRTFILGGTILETKKTREGTEIEMVQNPIDRYGSIIDSDVSEGRFIIVTARSLDSFIYKKGRHITLAGILIGTRAKKLGDLEYTYLLFDAKEIYLWKKERYFYPYAYDPFYYPYYTSPYPYYWYDPFYYRPYFYPW